MTDPIHNHDEPRMDAPRIDAPRIDAPRMDAPRIDAPRIDAPRIDAPRLLDAGQVLDVLTNGVIEEDHGLLPWGSNYTYLVSVIENAAEPADSPGDPAPLSLMAVYKPQRGERPLWDFPDGTLCRREVATYRVSEELGWQIVPPTVLRGGPFGLGSVQFFVHHDPDLNYFTPFPGEVQDQLMRVAAFDYITNNADRKGGHCILDGQGHLWGIDHGLTFHPAPKLRTVIWDYAGQPLPDFIREDLARLCDSFSGPETDFQQAMRQLISQRELDAFQHRVERLLRKQQFPQPGPGPNYPWPPL